MTISKLSVDEQKEIKEDLLSENFWWKDSLKKLDSWVAFYYQNGRFPGSVYMPIFLKTEMFLSPMVLYKKFSGTDAKGLVSIHALAALNIYFGGSQIASQTSFGELLKT